MVNLMFPCLLLAHVVIAAVCSTRNPSGCDELSREVAFRFFCDDSHSEECVIRMNQQLTQIAPVDFPGFDGLVKASRPGFEECFSTNRLMEQGSILFCSPRFLGPMTFARLPASISQARALNSSLSLLEAELDQNCGLTWSLKNCPDFKCPDQNATCLKETDFTLVLRQATRMSLLFAAKREHNHLLNMNVSCFTQGSSECSAFVAARLAESSSWISKNAPKGDDKALLSSVTAAKQLWKRTCNGDLPCVNALLDPILKSVSNEELDRALNSANWSLTNPILSQDMEDEVIRNISQPAAPCNSIEATVRPVNGMSECRAATKQVLQLFHSTFTYHNMEARLTPNLIARVSKLLSDCWMGCRLLSQAQIYINDRKWSLEVTWVSLFVFCFLKKNASGTINCFCVTSFLLVRLRVVQTQCRPD
jgi:hypothetical protein